MSLEMENSEMVLDAMSVHPDWAHIETLSLNPSVNTLIIVPGHALFFRDTEINSPEFNPTDVRFWSLNEFQDAEELGLLIDQMRVGVLTAAKIPNSVIVFSGACTREAGGDWTEAESYFETAKYFDWWSMESGVPVDNMRKRAFAEVYALDSMDNLTRSIRLFQMAHQNHEVPIHVIVVGWPFKKARFEMHSKELGIPKFDYIGIKDPPNFKNDKSAHKREEDIAALYKSDPFSLKKNSEVALRKARRNVKKIIYPYGTSLEIKELYKRQFERRDLASARNN